MPTSASIVVTERDKDRLFQVIDFFPTASDAMKRVLVTGMSGTGKSAPGRPPPEQQAGTGLSGNRQADGRGGADADRAVYMERAFVEAHQ